MSYAQLLDRLFQKSSYPRVKQDLENARAFDRALGFPTSFFPTIHIAGSNGKGSVATKIAKALEFSGYRVGLYTSPHLFSFRERIVINGESISEEAVIEGLQRLFSIEKQQQLHASFFECTTFLAFDYFRNKHVDVAVIETGLGGRLDATNVIHPLLSVITSISREHTQVLGDNIEQISQEKAGILKEKVPVVLGPKARTQAIYDRAKQLECPIFASKKIGYFFDEENTDIAKLALEQLSLTICPDASEKGLKVRPPCRFEQQGEVIFDVAHNPEAIFYLLQALHHFFPHRKFHFVVGFSKDKEYGSCLELIANVATHITLVQADSSRAATVEELKSALRHENLALLTSFPSIEKAVAQAYLQARKKEEILVICGSFYIMADAKRALSHSSQETMSYLNCVKIAWI